MAIDRRSFLSTLAAVVPATWLGQKAIAAPTPAFVPSVKPRPQNFMAELGWNNKYNKSGVHVIMHEPNAHREVLTSIAAHFAYTCTPVHIHTEDMLGVLPLEVMSLPQKYMTFSCGTLSLDNVTPGTVLIILGFNHHPRLDYQGLRYQLHVKQLKMFTFSTQYRKGSVPFDALLMADSLTQISFLSSTCSLREELSIRIEQKKNRTGELFNGWGFKTKSGFEVKSAKA